MQRDHDEAMIAKLLIRPDRRRTQARHLTQQCIDHGIADEEDTLFRHPGFPEVLVGDFAGGEEVVGDGIGHHPIDLLRH